MSVVCWDGKTLAADRQTTYGDVPRPGRKLFPLPGGGAIATVGPTDHGRALVAWVCEGADAAKFPPVPENPEERAQVIVASRFGIEECYGDTPAFMPQRQPGIWAWGVGREVAIGAMAMGADAATAVKIACKWNIYCGMGVDAIQVKK